MAEAAIVSAVQLLGNLLMQKVEFLGSVQGQVRSLKDQLTRMLSFLRDANKKQAEEDKVRNWVVSIIEVAHDVQDTMEMLLVDVENVKHDGLLKSCPSYNLDRIGDELRLIQSRLDALENIRQSYGIKDLGQAPLESRRWLAEGQKDEQVVGMRHDVKTLLREAVMDVENKGVSIVVVEGMGGIGKSTLARKIYQHPAVFVGHRFDLRAWVVVSSECSPQEMIKWLILELDAGGKGKLSKTIQELEESTRDDKIYLHEMLQEMLHRQLSGKTYFIVFDDVGERGHLEYLRDALPDERDKTSRLLVTTQNTDIARYGQYVHQMKLLTPRKSCILLLKKASVDDTSGNFPQEFDSAGREILEICDGLPLAISIVGGLLVERKSKSGWEQVLDQIKSHRVRAGRVESSVSTILELGYQDLSPQLKSCFLCLAFLQQDETIPVKRLVHLWVGQGLIQQKGRRMVEKITREYLDELIKRNLVQVKDWTLDDQVKSCHLHDLVRELCLRKAKEEIGFQKVPKEEGTSSAELSSDWQPRHCVVDGESISNLLWLQNTDRLRSLFLLNVNGGVMSSTPHCWKRFQLLKILDLDVVGLRRFP